MGREQAMTSPVHRLRALAVSAGAFNWLADEPDLYNDRSGEPA